MNTLLHNCTHMQHLHDNRFELWLRGKLIVKYSELIQRLQKLTNITPTQSELCNIIGIKPSTMSNRVKRDSNFTVKELAKINKFYSINLYTNCTQAQQHVTFDYEALKQIMILFENCISDNHIAIAPEKKAKLLIILCQLYSDNINNLSLDIIKHMCELAQNTDWLFLSIQYFKLYNNTIKVISDNTDKYVSLYIDFSKETDVDFQIIGEVQW